MRFQVHGREIATIGVIGAGVMGPAIAKFFAQALPESTVVLVDSDDAKLAAGHQRAVDAIRSEHAKKGKPERADAEIARLRVGGLDALAGADLVIEAVVENAAVKAELWERVEGIVGPDVVLLSGSSHIEPERVFARLKHPARAAVAHFFYPADRNPLVEVVAGRETANDVVVELSEMLERIGKLPVRVQSRYGFAVNPVAEGLLAEACRIVEEGLAPDTVQVDLIAQEVLRMKAGPFSHASRTATLSIAADGLDEMAGAIHPWFATPALLREQVAVGQPFPAPDPEDAITLEAGARAQIADRLLGAYIALACDVLDGGICDLGDLDVALSTALDAASPFALYNELGPEVASAKVEAFRAAADDKALPVSGTLRRHAEAGAAIEIPVVLTEIVGNVALIKIRRPKVLNALNDDVFAQLDDVLKTMAEYDQVEAVVLTGYGNRSFIAGADIPTLAAILDAPDPSAAAIAKCRLMQAPLLRMEALGKPVVIALNGLALGGGSEVALAGTVRIGVPRLIIGQPEPNLGLIPGAGGTQRLPRLVGLEAAWPILRTAAPISAQRALEIGYLDEIVEPAALRVRAIELARDLAAGRAAPKVVPDRAGLDTTSATPPPADSEAAGIGHLSRKIDELLVRAVVEGCAKPLREGLEDEYEQFGRCFQTEDARIGLANFVQNGPRAKAAFLHR